MACKVGLLILARLPALSHSLPTHMCKHATLSYCIFVGASCGSDDGDTFPAPIMLFGELIKPAHTHR